MKIDLRIAGSVAGVLVAAGAIVGGVALADQPSAHTPAKAPAVSSPAAPGPVSSAAVVATRTVTSPRPSHHPHSVARSTRHAVAPKETTVSEPSSEPTTSEPASFIPASDDNGRAGNAPPPPAISQPPVAVPSGYNQPSDSPSD